MGFSAGLKIPKTAPMFSIVLVVLAISPLMESTLAFQPSAMVWEPSSLRRKWLHIARATILLDADNGGFILSDFSVTRRLMLKPI